MAANFLHFKCFTVKVLLTPFTVNIIVERFFLTKINHNTQHIYTVQSTKQHEAKKSVEDLKEKSRGRGKVNISLSESYPKVLLV